MRWSELNIITEGRNPPSAELIKWVSRWVQDSSRIDDQIAGFWPLADEAARFLNVSYPALYRGLSITEEQLSEISRGQTIKIPCYRLQSWTKSRAIALDYALPGHGGDVGVLVRKTGRRVTPRADIENVLRAIGKRTALGVDAAREREVVVELPGYLSLNITEILVTR